MTDIISNFSFILGFFLTIILTVTTLIFWLLGAANNIRVEVVNLFFGFSKFFLFKKKVNNLQLSLGFLPTGSAVKFAGVHDETFNDEEPTIPKPYEFRGKSKLVKYSIVFTNPILLFFAGTFIIVLNATLPLLEIVKHWFKTALFLQPLDDGNVLWEQFFTDYTFLFGCLALLSSFGGFISNISMIKSKESVSISIITFAISLLLFSPLLRLIFTYINFKSAILFFTSSLLFGTIAMLIFFLLANSFKRLSN